MALDCLRVDCSLCVPSGRTSFPLLRLDRALLILSLGFSIDFLADLSLLLGLISSPEGIKPRLDDDASSTDDLAESLAELFRGDFISKSLIPELIDGFLALAFDLSE